MKSASQEVAIFFSRKNVNGCFNVHFARYIDQGELSQSNHGAGDKTFTSFVSNITKLAWGAGWFWMKGHSL